MKPPQGRKKNKNILSRGKKSITLLRATFRPAATRGVRSRQGRKCKRQKKEIQAVCCFFFFHLNFFRGTSSLFFCHSVKKQNKEEARGREGGRDYFFSPSGSISNQRSNRMQRGVATVTDVPHRTTRSQVGRHARRRVQTRPLRRRPQQARRRLFNMPLLENVHKPFCTF